MAGIAPVDCLDGEVHGVGEEVVVVGGRVDDDVEAGRHLGADDDAEGGDGGVAVRRRELAPRLQDDVLRHDHPVEVRQRKVLNKKLIIFTAFAIL